MNTLEALMDKLIILNYQSERGIDNSPSYNFWFTSSLIRVIADKPFGRGDVARVVDIKKPTQTQWNIMVEILGDPDIEEDVKELVTQEGREIPTLVFATTKIYLDEASKLHVYGSDNIEILLNCDSTMNNNKSYTIAALVTGNQGKIIGVDQINGTEVEWLITDNPTSRRS